MYCAPSKNKILGHRPPMLESPVNFGKPRKYEHIKQNWARQGQFLLACGHCEEKSQCRMPQCRTWDFSSACRHYAKLPFSQMQLRQINVNYAICDCAKCVDNKVNNEGF